MKLEQSEEHKQCEDQVLCIVSCVPMHIHHPSYFRCTCCVTCAVAQLPQIAAIACLEILADARGAALRRQRQTHERRIGGCAAQHPGTCARNFAANSSGSEKCAADACTQSFQNSMPAHDGNSSSSLCHDKMQRQSCASICAAEASSSYLCKPLVGRGFRYSLRCH